MIAICVGHSRRNDNGAVSVDSTSEHTFNSGIARELKAILSKRGICSEVFDQYDADSYGAAMSWVAHRIKSIGASATVELHFNSATPTAHGHEFLYWGNSTGGKKLARAFAESYQDHFPQSTPRREGGLFPITKSARGSQFLQKTHCPALILEPFFGSNREEWSIASHDPSRIAHAYASAIVAYFD